MNDELRLCLVCEAPIVGQRNKRICSKECANKRNYLNRKSRPGYIAYRKSRVRPSQAPLLVCPSCGVEFQRRGLVDGGRRFCFECSPPGNRSASHRLSKKHPTTAADERIRLQKRATRLRAARRRLARASDGTAGTSPWASGECSECGQLFVDRAGWTSSYCSQRCAARRLRRDAKARRRSHSRGGRVNRRKVFERDKWTCQICQRKLDRDAIVPLPLAPTIDHIVPLASGGEHEDFNAQACCFECNYRKADGFVDAGEQLRLIG